MTDLSLKDFCQMYLLKTQLTFTCSKSAIEIRRSGVFTVNFEHISHLFLRFLLLTLNKEMLAEKFDRETCFKNPDSLKTIDLILTNRPKSFRSSDTMENGLSDFHRFIRTVLETISKRYKLSQL